MGGWGAAPGEGWGGVATSRSDPPTPRTPCLPDEQTQLGALGVVRVCGRAGPGRSVSAQHVGSPSGAPRCGPRLPPPCSHCPAAPPSSPLQPRNQPRGPWTPAARVPFPGFSFLSG